MRFWVPLGLVLLLLPVRVSAEPVVLAGFEGEPVGSLQGLAQGDVEDVRFRPEHPFRLTGIRLNTAGGTVPGKVQVWLDGGGHQPDMEAPMIGELTAAPLAEGGWIELAVEPPLEIDPPRDFHVGYIHGDGTPGVRVDEAAGPVGFSLLLAPDQEGTPTWYNLENDYLVEAQGEYFDKLETRWFQELPELAGASRVAFGDYDGDGDEDVLISGSRLMRNDGGFAFTEVSEAAGLVAGIANGAVWADYDNDGHLDFFATSGAYAPACQTDEDCLRPQSTGSGGECPAVEGYFCHPTLSRCVAQGQDAPVRDLLYHNNGDGTFTPVKDGPGDFLPTEAAAWGDYDNDGLVDLYLANYETPISWSGCQLSQPNPDFLWRNLGDGTFADVSEQVGLRSVPDRCGRGVNWGDFDNDGDLDIFVSNYRLHPNFLWENQGNGLFVERAQAYGVRGVQVQQAFGHTIGSEWGDYDNDGDLDLISANLAHPRFITFSDKTMLLQNQGSGQGFSFTDQREAAGISYRETHSEPSLGDFDNDGDLDLHLTCIYQGRASSFFVNQGDATFVAGDYPSGLVVDNGWGAGWADLDDDGDLDFVSRAWFRNDLEDFQPQTSWLKLRLRGTVSNAAAIGARVVIHAGELQVLREVSGGKGTGNQSSLVVHAGLGPATVVDQVEIHWPGQGVQTFGPLAVNQALVVTEGEEPKFLAPQPLVEPGPETGEQTLDLVQEASGRSGDSVSEVVSDVLEQERAGGSSGCAQGTSGPVGIVPGLLALLVLGAFRQRAACRGR